MPRRRVTNKRKPSLQISRELADYFQGKREFESLENPWPYFTLTMSRDEDEVAELLKRAIREGIIDVVDSMDALTRDGAERLIATISN